MKEKKRTVRKTGFRITRVLNLNLTWTPANVYRRMSMINDMEETGKYFRLCRWKDESFSMLNGLLVQFLFLFMDSHICLISEPILLSVTAYSLLHILNALMFLDCPCVKKKKNWASGENQKKMKTISLKIKVCFGFWCVFAALHHTHHWRSSGCTNKVTFRFALI